MQMNRLMTSLRFADARMHEQTLETSSDGLHLEYKCRLPLNFCYEDLIFCNI